jgi:hypothetical protein
VAAKTREGWKKVIGEAMARKRAEAPQKKYKHTHKHTHTHTHTYIHTYINTYIHTVNINIESKEWLIRAVTDQLKAPRYMRISTRQAIYQIQCLRIVKLVFLKNCIIIIIIIFINCNWIAARWQWLTNTYAKHEIGLLLNLRREGYMRST